MLERGLNSASLRTLFKLAGVLDVPVSDMLILVEQEMASQGRLSKRRIHR